LPCSPQKANTRSRRSSTLEPGEKAQGVAISKAGNIPKKFLDAILGELRNAGVVFTKKGPGGGYMLARAASDIKIGHVVRAIDGPLAAASRTFTIVNRTAHATAFR